MMVALGMSAPAMAQLPPKYRIFEIVGRPPLQLLPLGAPSAGETDTTRAIINPLVKPTYWKKDGNINFTFQNTGFSNWAEGGASAISVGLNHAYKANYEYDNHSWQNGYFFEYGLSRQDGSEFLKKTVDRFNIYSQYNSKIGPHWSMSAFVRCTTQVAPGYRYSPDQNNPGGEIEIQISDFLSPGRLASSIGMEYKKQTKNKKTNMTALFSPLSGQLTTVLNDSLSSVGAFGVERGKKLRSELGLAFSSRFSTEAIKNVKIENSLDLFANFSTLAAVDVNWETNIVMKVNKHINTRFSTRLIYDEDIPIKRDDGTTGPEVQFRHVLNVGIGFVF